MVRAVRVEETLMTGSSGVAATVTVVVANFVASSAEVAVMVTLWAEAGAVQEPEAGFMVPALADQMIEFDTPPVAVAAKVVVVPTVRTGAAGVTAPTLTVWGFRVTEVLATVPAALVTVNWKDFAAVMAPLLKEVPLVTVPTAWSTVPVPPLKVGVMVLVPP